VWSLAAYVEESWRLPPQSGDLLCSDFGCVRLYSTIPKVYYLIAKFIITQPPIGEKDDYDSENSWTSDGLPSSSRTIKRRDGRWEGDYVIDTCGVS